MGGLSEGKRNRSVGGRAVYLTFVLGGRGWWRDDIRRFLEGSVAWRDVEVVVEEDVFEEDCRSISDNLGFTFVMIGRLSS